MKVKLTSSIVKQLPIKEKAYSVKDSECRGLVVRVYPSGSKHYGVVLKVKGVVKRKSIGSCEVWGVPAARKVAREVARELDAMTPSTTTITTVKDLYHLHIKLRPLEPSTLRGYRGYWEELPEAFRCCDADKLSRRAVRDWHTEKAQHTTYLANRCVALLKAILSTGVEENLIESNQLLGFSMGGESVSEDYPTIEQAFGIITRLEKEPRPASKVPIIVIFTGCRITTILKMKWNDINGDTWTTPLTKNKHRYTITFHPYILGIIRSIPRTSEWVFASEAGGALKDIKHVITREQIGFAPRSMKKVFASVAAELIPNLAVLKTLCQHKTIKDITLDVYARTDPQTIREGYLKVGNFLSEGMKKNI